MQPRLMRSRTEVIVAGVCGGLAEYFAIDPVIVRLTFVLVTLTSGLGLLIYPILWICDAEGGQPLRPRCSRTMPKSGGGARRPLARKPRRWASSSAARCARYCARARRLPARAARPRRRAMAMCRRPRRRTATIL